MAVTKAVSFEESEDSMYDSDAETDTDDDLMVLMDEYDEKKYPENFGRIVMKTTSVLGNMHKIYAKGKFYLPPHSKRCYEVDLKHVICFQIDGVLDGIELICNILNPKLFDLDSEWQPSSSYISREKKYSLYVFSKYY